MDKQILASEGIKSRHLANKTSKNKQTKIHLPIDYYTIKARNLALVFVLVEKDGRRSRGVDNDDEARAGGVGKGATHDCPVGESKPAIGGRLQANGVKGHLAVGCRLGHGYYILPGEVDGRGLPVLAHHSGSTEEAVELFSGCDGCGRQLLHGVVDKVISSHRERDIGYRAAGWLRCTAT